MGQPVIQTSFNAGEWAPALNARVDMAKYHSGAALLRNFFVDYRGGATTRPGSKYILPAKTNGARLIPFQASFSVSYLLEFGNNYVRFYNNGSPVLENAAAISSITNANPGVFDIAATYSVGDWIFITGAVGMTQVNGNYYIIASNPVGTDYTLTDLFGNVVDTTSFGVYGGSATAQRVYTITSPYLTSEVFGIKFAQDVNLLFMCHPNHAPQLLTFTSATNWSIAPINFGPTLATPLAISVASTAAGGTDNLAYVVTAVDANGVESAPTTPAHILNLNFNTSGWTNTVVWLAVTGAFSYNVYKSNISANGPVASGSQYGFIGNVTGLTFQDTLIGPNFALTPPIVRNPFSGSSLANIAITAAGNNYTSVPTVSIGAPPTGGVQATASVVLSAVSVTIAAGGVSYAVGNIINTASAGGIVATVTSTGAGGAVTGISVDIAGGVSGNAPANPLSTFVNTGSGSGCTLNATWGVAALTIGNPGAGYLVAPAIGFSGGGGAGATATATLTAASGGNATVPGFVQQRSVFGGPVLSPSQINLSQTGAPFNFNVSSPTVADDAIQETLTNTTLNTIKSFTTVAAGLLILTDKGAWVVNGGSFGSGISATSIVANPQTYSGSNDLPPIVAPNDILYMKSQGSVVVDLTYNFYLSNYTGTDISILSSHLFYGFSFPQWTWAEEPFKIAWLVRNDGELLSLSFVKEQELVAWAHHDTNGTYTSVASIIESTAIGSVSAVYVIAQRTIQGQTVQYIERFVELNYPNGYKSSWQVDAGIGYNGAAKTTFSGAQHLGGQVVTGVADGAVINFTMPVSGTFVFGPGGTAGLTGIANASIVTVGLGYLPQIQTLRLDLGEPTVQGKRKKISAVTVRCNQALGLSIGSTFTTLTPMKDLVLGNIGTMSNAKVTDLVTDDARTILDTNWTVPGQFCIQQNNPYPASVLGIIPEIDVGDTPR